MKKGDVIAKPPKKRKGVELISNNELSAVTQPLVSKIVCRANTVNLDDWLDSNILVKDGLTHYYSGIIKSVPTATSVEVVLDRNNETHIFHDVLSKTDCIISNHSAPAIMIKKGLAVCVKLRPSDNFFSVAVVREIKQGPPVQCLVQMTDTSQEHWVSRASIRLIQPPWYDDLEDTGGQEVSSPFDVSYAKLVCCCLFGKVGVKRSELLSQGFLPMSSI